MASLKPIASGDKWLEELKEAKKTCLVSEGRKKVHYLFTSGVEMAEDYDVKTCALLIRKFKRKDMLGGLGRWEFEVGMAPSVGDVGDMMMESHNNPIFSRVDSPTHFQWRVRNLPYPKSNYLLSCEEASREIVIKTENKKYYKKFNIPDMDRCDIPFTSDSLSFDHANNTLIVSYKKPQGILTLEKKVLQEISQLKAGEDGQADCAQS